MSSRRQKSTTACMILAAGKGTRMNSAQNKVLHTLLGVPMVAYAVESARGLGATSIVGVLGHQLKEVAKALDDRFGPGCVTVVEQKVQKGTGHAVRLGLGPLADFDGLVVILYGDVPLLRMETLGSHCSGGLSFYRPFQNKKQPGKGPHYTLITRAARG